MAIGGGGGSTEPTGTQFLDLVSHQIGTPYVWGGDQPGGFDCSGLVYWAAQHLGVSVPRTSEGQWGAVDRIKADQLQPGDLIFMNFPGEASPGHVVIYAGGDQIIQAPSTGQLVQRDSFHSGTAQAWGAQIVGYGRIPGLDYQGEKITTNLGSGGTTGGGGGQGGPSPVDTAVGDIFHALSLPFGWVGGATSDIASSVIGLAAPFVKIAGALDWFLHPNHWIRILAGLAGGILVFGGVFQMTHVGAS